MDGGSGGGMGGGGCRGEAHPSAPKEAVAGGVLLGALPVVRPGHADAAVERVVGGGCVAVAGGPVPVDSFLSLFKQHLIVRYLGFCYHDITIPSFNNKRYNRNGLA